MHETQRYSALVTVAQNHAEFIAGIERELREDSPEKRAERSEAMRGESWEVKVMQLGQAVMKVKAAKRVGEQVSLVRTSD